MITGLKVDNSPRAVQSGGSNTGSKASGARKADQADFADQLLGAKSERLEGPDRKERKQPGREASEKGSREGSRSTEREREPKADSDLRASRGDVRRKKKDDRDDSRTPASQSVSPHQPQTKTLSKEPPIVIEAPKGEDSQELRLPDFFSKVEAGKDTKGLASKLTPEGAAATGETADMLSGMKQTEVLSRQEAMGEFVARMESELGIPPEKLLQAISQLDQSVLDAPPAESVSQFLGALDLQEGQQAQATEMYQDLLKKTGDSLINEKVAGLDASVNFEVLSSRDASLKKLSTSLDDLNVSFFRKDEGKELAANPQKAQVALESMDSALARLMAAKQTDIASQVAVPKASEALAGVAMVQANSTNPLSTALQSGANESEFDFGDLSEGGESVSLMAGEKEAKSSFADELRAGLKQEESDLSDLGGEANTETFADAEVTPGATPVVGTFAQAASKAAMVTGPADMIMNRQPTSADEQANVRDLIKNAQLMVKRGGGEMKLEMTPEGMGKVHLKVAVENGQVNVQMLTESDSAKRLLEKGMSELRSTLAAQDLKVASMSVDVGSDVSKQMDQQGTQDQARQQARNFAQDFMGSFRDERQGFRQGMLESTGMRSYGRNQRREELNPEVSASVSASSRAKSGETKRLNLVA